MEAGCAGASGTPSTTAWRSTPNGPDRPSAEGPRQLGDRQVNEKCSQRTAGDLAEVHAAAALALALGAILGAWRSQPSLLGAAGGGLRGAPPRLGLVLFFLSFLAGGGSLGRGTNSSVWERGGGGLRRKTRMNSIRAWLHVAITSAKGHSSPRPRPWPWTPSFPQRPRTPAPGSPAAWRTCAPRGLPCRGEG